MGFRNFILYTTLVILVLYVTRVNNIWGVSKNTTKAKEDARKEKDVLKKRLRYAKAYKFFEDFGVFFGSAISKSTEADYQYRLGRLRWKIKYLNREMKPAELWGILKIVQLLGVGLGLVLIVLTGSILWLMCFTTLLAPSLFKIISDSKIMAEDKELEDDFPGLFSILYSRLLKGTQSRLAPPLDDYLKSLDATYGGKSHLVIRNFVMDIRNSIEIHGDDSMAIAKLRDYYKSALVINFCNLATQSFKGIDNRDNLLSFKIDLNQKMMAKMEKKAEEKAIKGRRSTYVVYIILAEFVVLSWIAKLGGTGGITKIIN